MCRVIISAVYTEELEAAHWGQSFYTTRGFPDSERYRPAYAQTHMHTLTHASEMEMLPREVELGLCHV